MTFEPWIDGQFLIRFEHILEKDEDSELSKPIRFNLLDVFPGMVIELREVILSANQFIEDSQRLHFKQETSEFLDEMEQMEEKTETEKDVPEIEISLNPMEIKTFVMKMYANV